MRRQKCVIREKEGEEAGVFCDLSQGGAQSGYLEAPFLPPGKEDSVSRPRVSAQSCKALPRTECGLDRVLQLHPPPPGQAPSWSHGPTHLMCPPQKLHERGGFARQNRPLLLSSCSKERAAWQSENMFFSFSFFPFKML